MSNFTPGPWKVCGSGEFIIAAKGNAKIMTAVASVSGIKVNPERTKADARLIAAAPEMYEALKEVAPYVSICDYEMEGADGGKAEELFNVINALLGRIDGEEETE